LPQVFLPKHISLEDPPQELAELRAVLLADQQWRRGEGLA
jgi:hypothetical protein